MKRYSLPDLHKGFAVSLIVPIHIMETFIDYTERESLFGKILLVLGGPAATPVFMLAMGYIISKSNKPLLKNIVCRVKIFAIGLLLNIVLNFNLLLKLKYAGWQ